MAYRSAGNIELRIIDPQGTRVASLPEIEAVHAIENGAIIWRLLSDREPLTTRHDVEAAGVDGVAFYL